MNAVPPIKHGNDDDIKEVINIHKDFTKRIINDTLFINMDANAKLAYYHKHANNMVTKYPIIFRYMCETGQFHPKAMRKYIDKLKKSPYKTEEEYCERNADYIKYLYLVTNNNHNMKEALQLWADAKKALMDELSDFKKRMDSIKKEINDMKTTNATERANELKNKLNAMKI